MNTLNPGDDFDQLAESYVIFITGDDVLGKNLPIYHIDRMIKETGTSFEDRSHIINVNASIQDTTELGQLMHDFHCKNANEMHSKILAGRVEQARETALSLAGMGLAAEQIAQAVKVSVQLVQEWLAERSSSAN